MQPIRRTSFIDRLWSEDSRFIYLIIAASVLLFFMLGERELWTQEHRWADIVFGMFYRHDYLHPYLGTQDYYDKPLLSYWFIIALSHLFGALSTWALRLPSALAGLLALWAIYRLGILLENKRLGIVAAWLLLTTFYFVFWARTSSADMLNLSGILCAVWWYFEKKSTPNFFTYSVFFLILAITSLCKGLTGAVVPILAILPDLMMGGAWKKHLRVSLLFAIIPAVLIYLLPFLLSIHIGGQSYGESGLYLVYKENILRYFQPFDHQGPIYTYLIYLPIYLLPWTIFFIPAVVAAVRQWRTLSRHSRWIIWATLLVFIFFTLSGSRRSYYILPLVPFAILMTADWLLRQGEDSRWYRASKAIAISFFLGLLVNFGVIQPLYYSQGNTPQFAQLVKQHAEKIRPWTEWNIIMLDARSRVRYYLQLSPLTKNYPKLNANRSQPTAADLLKAWPILQTKPANTLFISRRTYLIPLREILTDYDCIDAPLSLSEQLSEKTDLNAPIACIAKK